MIAGFLSVAIATSGVPMTTLEQIRLPSAYITVAHVVDLGGLGERQRLEVGNRIIAKLPAGRTTVLTRETVALLVRRTVPALSPRIDGGRIKFIAPAASIARRTGCVALRRAIPAGGTIVPDDLTDGSCEPPQRRLLRFDNGDKSIRALEDLPAGRPFGRLALPARPAVAPGARLLLQSTSGPVTIRREVVAMQYGTQGRRIFVRDADGLVLAIKLILENGEEEQ